MEFMILINLICFTGEFKSKVLTSSQSKLAGIKGVQVESGKNTFTRITFIN